MNQLLGSVASSALNKVISNPARQTGTNSRNADKFVIRSSRTLFDEIAAIGANNIRSLNSEMVESVLDSLSDNKRSKVLIHALANALGKTKSDEIIRALPVFKLEDEDKNDISVIRFPDSIRAAVATAAKEMPGGNITMNDWIIGALIQRVNTSRQINALMAASIAIH